MVSLFCDPETILREELGIIIPSDWERYQSPVIPHRLVLPRLDQRQMMKLGNQLASLGRGGVVPEHHTISFIINLAVDRHRRVHRELLVWIQRLDSDWFQAILTFGTLPFWRHRKQPR